MMFTICQFENEALDEMNDGKFKKKKRVWGQMTSSWFKMERNYTKYSKQVLNDKERGHVAQRDWI